MAAKKITLQVIGDAVQHDGVTYPNGQQFDVTEKEAKELAEERRGRQGVARDALPEPPPGERDLRSLAERFSEAEARIRAWSPAAPSCDRREFSRQEPAEAGSVGCS
jgi:hypothetical protein